MTDDGVTFIEDQRPADNKPDRFERGMFILSLVALIVALWAWFIVFAARFKVIYDALGMTELPFVTQLTLDAGFYGFYILLLAVLGFIVVGVVVIRRDNRKSMNRITAINWIIVALIPGYIYFTMHMPLLELHKKLGGG